MRETFSFEPSPAAAYIEELGDMIREDAFASHTGNEAWVVKPPTSHGTNAVQDLLLALGESASEPILEERADGVRKAHGGVGGEACAGLGGGGDQVRQLMVVEAGDHGRGHHPDGNTGPGERFDGRQSSSGRGGARLHDAPQVVVQGGQGDGDHRGVVSGELGEEVYIPGDEVVLGDYSDGVTKLREDFEAAARDAELLLDGLVTVGDAAYGEHLGFPPRG